MRMPVIILLFLYVLAVGRSFADTTLEFGVYDQSIKRIRVDTIRIRSGVVRLPEAAGTYMLFDQSSRQLIQVDSARKSYTPINPGSIDQVKQKTQEVFEKVREALEKMPPEQRAQIEKTLDQLGSNPLEAAFPVSKVTVVKTGRTQQLYGTNCTVTETFVDGVKRFEICLAQSSNLEISAADSGAYSDYMNYMVDFSRALSSSVALGQGVVTNYGIPLSSTQFLPDGTIIQSLLENVLTQPLDPQLFVIPGNFKNHTLVP